ncbi:MAG TPA: hypothetical protein VFV67_03485 [Actinophytocola sp.]|nr:hypothetical protein [Actinophytocola sp.]HEU5469690.1 hypothetical protein [Actinophytocola sp.]
MRASLYRALRQAMSAVAILWTDCDHEDRGDVAWVAYQWAALMGPAW